MSHKRHDAAFEAKVAAEALKGIKSLSELSAEGVHPVQISSWKKKLVENIADIFAKKTDKARQERRKKRRSYTGKLGNSRSKTTG